MLIYIKELETKVKTNGWVCCVRYLSASFLLSCVSAVSQVLFSSFIAPQHSAYAQSNIVPDITLGLEASEVIPNFNNTPNELITGGAQRGQNLFHSFRDFNVGENRGAYFLVFDPSIQNILARVTGNNRSEILGTLGTRQVIGGNFFRSNANLFLMNPNGIIFGEKASLDVNGSFVATTANGVQFGNQGNFSTTNTQTPGVLTVNPSALFFGAVAKQGVITVNQSILGVAPGKNLTLVGGDISLNGSALEAFGGRVELTAIAGTGTVGVNKNGSLSVSENLERANTGITNSWIDVASDNGGSVTINADNLDISASTIQAGIFSGLGTDESKAGDITINTTGKLLINESVIRNWVFPNAIGKGGDIRINTDSMTFNGFGLEHYISAIVWGKGNAGSVFVNAKNDIAVNNANIFSLVQTGGEGNAGNIDITTRNLSLTRAAWLSASTLGKGNGGNVIINASDRVSVDGVSSELRPSAIRSIIEKNGVGKGGNILINTGSLSVTNSGKIDTSVFGKGHAGDVTINARDTVSLDGWTQGIINSSSIFTTVEDEGIGNAGNININTGSLFVINGGSLLSRTENQGNAGNITIQARDSVVVDGASAQNFIDKDQGLSIGVGSSEITSSVEKNARGNAGNILINAGNNISLNPDAKVVISASPDGADNTNDIDTALLSQLNGVVMIRASSDGEGNAGTITINAGNQLLMNNEAEVRTTTNGRGNAGDITIKAGDRISLDNDAVITSLILEEGIGSGGDIKISTGSLSVAGAAQLDTSTFGEGDAGDVIINARDAVLFTGGKPELNLYSGVLSTSERNGKGSGGNIEINASSVTINDAATLSTFTNKKGNAGNVRIQARDQITLTNESEIKTISFGEGDAGEIKITGGALSLSNNSLVSSDTLAQGSAGNISVNVDGQVNLDNKSFIASAVGSNTKGNGGSIAIAAESLSMTSGSQLRTNTFGRGNAGNITINTSGDVSLSKLGLQEYRAIFTAIASNVESNGIGNAGIIRVNSRNLVMKDSSILKASTEGLGDSGNIFINASDSVFLDSRAIISNIVGDVGNPGKFGDGKGGIIRIDTGTLSMLNGSQLQASTFGRGDAGDIIINARENFLASGFGQFDNLTLPTAVFSVVADDSKGNGGNIRVNTDSAFVEDGARFSVSTSGQGRAGNITIDARDAIVVDGISRVGFFSELSTATQENATGEGGKITVNTNSFRVSNRGLVNAQTTSAFRGGDVTINTKTFEALQGGRIFTTATNQGQAGNITVNADTINLSGTNGRSISGLFANTIPAASGRGGNIQVNTRQLNVSDSAQTSVNSQGSGTAGDININAKKVEFTDNAKIIAETTSQDGGNIFIDNANLLLLRRESLISATAGEQGNGGNVNINSKFIIAIPKENSDIKANAFEGNGGRVQINTQLILGTEFRPQETNESDITASSRFGVSGIVNINSFDDSAIRNNLDELPEDAINTNALIANSCIARRNQQNGSFFVTGSGGLPARPSDAPLPSYSTGDVQPVTTEESTKLSTQKRRWQIGDPVLEPSGVYELPNGKLVLGKEC
jgi:filamentous hemagglutinin family protein